MTSDEQRFVTAVLASAGLDDGAYRAGPLRRRLPAVLRAVRSASLTVGAARVAADKRLAERAYNTLLIGHTEPFRDSAVFHELRAAVLPALAAGRTGLRVWSVGCSSGAELMSVALLLAERGIAPASRLRGVDCRPAAIDDARAHAATGIEAVVRERFPELAPWLESPGFVTATRRVEWAVEDAVAASHPEPWDLILCRNLAIYLQPAAATKLWERLAACLPVGGVLVTGKAEVPPRGLRLAKLAPCIFRREEAAA